MSIAERASLYQEKTGSVSSTSEVDRALDDLSAAKGKVRKLPLRERAALAEACLQGMMKVADEWVAAACRAKGLPTGSSLAAEEISGGPLATARYLRLIKQSLLDVDRVGKPVLPGKVTEGPDGQLKVGVLPTKGMFDSIAFSGFKADVWMQRQVTRNNFSDSIATYYQNGQKDEGICCVLGAGNVSSIPPTDAFSKLFQEGKVALLKMNPVNEYLGPIFERAFKPMIDQGFLRIVYGGADVGAHAVNHPAVDEVHITGSIYSHDTIVWGPPGPERDRRKAQHQPMLKKTITSELGNVSPWMVVPGPYSEKELRFQAENLASSILNNASFNCVATKVLVTSKNWKDRDRFLDMVQEILDAVPRRKAYYPGAADRFKKFTGHEAAGGEPGTLPWTMIRDVDPDKKDSLYFNEESFACVFVEVGLDASDPLDFLKKATEFANERLWGTLAATLVVHPSLRKDAAFEKQFQRTLADLRFGTIGVNYWSGLSYAMMCTPWGGHPGSTLEDAESGIGWVHNTYMLDMAEKTVLEGPLTLFPKPLWFPTHKNAAAVSQKVLGLYEKPSVLKLPGLLINALKG